MPLPLSPLLGFVLGAALAWVARQSLSAEEKGVLVSQALRVVVGFAVLVYGPVVGYFAAFHGDWSYLYLIPWRSVPSAVDLLFVLIAVASVAAGFLAAAPFARARKVVPFGLVVGLPAMLLVLAVAGAQRRLSTSGTYAQYQGSFGTEPIARTEVGRSVLLVDAVAIAGVAWCVRLLRARTSRRRPRS
jgi:hypothetical protein